MTGAHRDRSPLKRNITHREVGDTALFLLSEMASGMRSSATGLRDYCLFGIPHLAARSAAPIPGVTFPRYDGRAP